MGGVVLEHVDHVVKGNEGIVNGDDLSSLGNCRTQDQATDAAESVDSDLQKMLFNKFRDNSGMTSRKFGPFLTPSPSINQFYSWYCLNLLENFKINFAIDKFHFFISNSLS